MSKKSLLLAACALWWLAAPASAQPLDRRTFYTFKSPVEIPGATLPPGKYVFRMANPDSSSGVVQVVSDADKKVWGMFFTIPVQRPTPTEKSEVRFMETAPGTPAAVKTMWYIGERTGREFLYPRQQALRLARATKQPVLTTRTASAANAEPKSDDLSRVSAEGTDTRVADNAAADRAVADTASAESVQQGDAVPESYSLPPQQMASARTRLPKTASDMPMVGVVGMCLFGLGAALFAIRRART